MSTEDLGYEDAVPDSAKYGYEDATPDFGYEDARPDTKDYGYGDAKPDSADYGYEEAAPDTKDYGYVDVRPSSREYGYGDARPDTATDYGYEDATPDTTDYGYGDVTPDTAATDYGYGEPIPPDYHVSLNDQYDDDVGGGSPKGRLIPSRRRAPGRSKSDESWMSTATADSYGEYQYGNGDPSSSTQPIRRQRYRRRGSVTKYSIEAQDDVQKEYDDHADIINQFRNQLTLQQDNNNQGVNDVSSQYEDRSASIDKTTPIESSNSTTVPDYSLHGSDQESLDRNGHYDVVNNDTGVNDKPEQYYDYGTTTPTNDNNIGDNRSKGKSSSGNPNKKTKSRGKKILKGIRRRFSVR